MFYVIHTVPHNLTNQTIMFFDLNSGVKLIKLGTKLRSKTHESLHMIRLKVTTREVGSTEGIVKPIVIIGLNL